MTNKDKKQTEMLFRKDAGGIFAVMPYEIAKYDGSVTTYQHVGQHSAAEYFTCIAKSKPATPAEYSDLKQELEGLGYNIKVIKRINYERYLELYNEMRTAWQNPTI